MAFTVALIVMVALAPALTAPPRQVTVGAAAAQLKRLEAFTVEIAKPGGSVAMARTSVALAPPELFTVRV